MKRATASFCCAGMLWLAICSAPFGQVPVFRAKVDMVHLVCTVRDRKGNYVSDLSLKDFEVYENGRLQDIEFFSRASTADAPPVFLVLLLDTSDSTETKLEFTQRVGLEFLVNAFSLGDTQVAVVQFSSRVRLVHNFTQELIRLRLGVREIQAGGGTRLHDALWLAANQLLGGKNGRRVIVVFSDGEDLHSQMQKEEALRKLQTEHVLVFAVGVQDPHYPSDFRSLEEICHETGGFFASSDVDMPGLKAAFDRIYQEIRQQYTLGYRSNLVLTEGQFREVTVRLKRRGLKVNHRRGYFTG